MRNLMRLLCGFAVASTLAIFIAAPAWSVDISRPPEKLADLKFREVGAVIGTMNGDAVEEAVGDVRVVYYSDFAAMLAALNAGSVSAVVGDTPTLEVAAAADAALVMLSPIIREDDYSLAVRLDDKELGDAVRGAVDALREDGSLDRLKEKWVDGPAAEKRLDAAGEGAGAALRYGVAEMGEPFVYRDADGTLVGYDIELGRKVAEKLGRKLEVREMLFAELISALESGQVDLIGSSITVTPEREELVRFTGGYYRGGAAALTRK